MRYDESALQRVREDRLLIDRCDAWLFQEIGPFLGQRILEVGCGLGNLACLLQNRELYIGLDLSRESVSALQAQYADHSNMSFVCLDITNRAVLGLRDHLFDTVISVNVFEHIADDILALRYIYELLQPGGKLALIVPAHKWLYGSMDRAIGHHRRYTKASMTKNLAAAGFCIQKQRYLNALGALGWFINGRILRERVPPCDQLRAFNMLVPVLEWAERVVQSPVGISLVTVAMREGK